ncbi:VOC family protein [Capsulimonas corticalis]|nr:VOC family protein [Capsulimonas corticalis]
MTALPTIKAVVPFLPCSDLLAARIYYREALGFSGLDWIWGEPPMAAGVSRDGVWLFLSQDPDLAARMTGFRFYIDVENLESLYEQHQVASVKIVHPLEEKPWGTTEYTVEDIHGYHLHFRRAPE